MAGNVHPRRRSCTASSKLTQVELFSDTEEAAVDSDLQPAGLGSDSGRGALWPPGALRRGKIVRATGDGRRPIGCPSRQPAWPERAPCEIRSITSRPASPSARARPRAQLPACQAPTARTSSMNGLHPASCRPFVARPPGLPSSSSTFPRAGMLATSHTRVFISLCRSQPFPGHLLLLVVLG